MAGLPSLDDIEATGRRIAPHVVETPSFQWRDPLVEAVLGDGALHLKLEFLQRTGSFKARGAINNILALSEAERRRGVVAVSAGNHAVAVSYAARVLGVSAKVVMHRRANPARVEKSRAFGAEVILAEDIAQAFDTMNRIREDEGRALVHPFEGERTVLGTATAGLELARQVPDLDAVIVAVGGGGLIAGIGTAIKAVRPGCQVIGVEPTGAAGLTRSLELGRPVDRVDVDTIADSMGAPMHTPATFGICREVIDRMVQVDDDAMCRAMALLFDGLKLAMEPAGAAALAALLGPLRGNLEGRRVAAVLCGSNIDDETYCTLLKRGRNSLAPGGAG
ncbi:MAG TPA: threonine/serine dehydratase [Alphaproteobacteria bacterium]|nr:threonine/serine dehydratase [Alphaproteobacteria bacterium]